MIEKSKRKKRIDDEHRKNYDAGAVDVDERQLHRTGVRGRKIYVVLFLLMLLLLLFVANLVMLIVVYHVDNIGLDGMQSISFHKNGKTKWHQDSDLAYVYPLDGVIGGYEKENILFEGINQNVVIQGGKSGKNYPSVAVGPGGADIRIRKSFSFVDPAAGKKVLNLDHNTVLKTAGRFSGDVLKANSIRTPRIISDDNANLTFTGKFINVTGSEGVYMDSKMYQLQTQQDIAVTVNDARSSLNVRSGVVLDRSKLKDTSSMNHVVLDAHRYRLCACVNSGRLFRARIVDGKDSSCSSASTDPCA